MTLAELTRVEGTPEVAKRADISTSSVEKLRTGHVTKAMWAIVHLVIALDDEFHIDYLPHLERVQAKAPSAHLESLIALKRAWPDLRIPATFADMVERAGARDAAALDGHVETRGSSSR